MSKKFEDLYMSVDEYTDLVCRVIKRVAGSRDKNHPEDLMYSAQLAMEAIDEVFARLLEQRRAAR